jgi:hypothetical protein
MVIVHAHGQMSPMLGRLERLTRAGTTDTVGSVCAGVRRA